MSFVAHFLVASLSWLAFSTRAADAAAPPTRDSTFPTRFPGVRWDNQEWTLNNTVLEPGRYQSRISLANGYLGINLAALGPFFESDPPRGRALNGWPVFDHRQAFATIAGFYDSQPTLNGTNFAWLNQYGGESIISGVPHWAGLLLKAGGATLDASTDPRRIKNFQSSLNHKAGLMRWKYDWAVNDVGTVVSVQYTMFVNKLHINRAAVQVELKATRDLELIVIDILDGDCAVRTNFVEKHHHPDSSTICTSVRPRGIAHLTGNVCSSLRSRAFSQSQPFETQSKSPSTIAQSGSIKLRREETVVVSKFIGAASGDAFTDPQSVALESSLAGAKDGFTSQLDSHRQEWNSIMTDESVDNYNLAAQHEDPSSVDADIVELQILAITNPFHLLQNTMSSKAIALANNSTALDIWSMSVCGLGSSCYGGMIFWDAEVWMAPGLVLSHPQASQRIINYRVAQFPQAQKNVKMAFSSSKNQSNRFSSDDAVYPWTSARFGNCTGTGPCFDYEYHINGDIGLSFFNHLVATGNFKFFQQNLLPIYQAIAGFFSNLLSETPAKKYTLTNATDPDEWANHVDNPAYTMFLIKNHLTTANELGRKFGRNVNPTWAHQAENLALPIDKQTGIILEYEGMNSSIAVKQADVVLIDDFLDFPNSHPLENLEYYGTKQSPNGPAMTYGVYSVVNNRFQRSGCASYTYHLFSSQPYVRAPWFQFSEQLNDDYFSNGEIDPAFPFLTGVGGDYRVSVSGYLGLRLELDHFSIDPSLPPQIGSLRYRKIYWHGHPIQASSNQTHTTLSRPSTGALPDANPRYVQAPILVKVRSSHLLLTLQPASTLVVPNRVVHLADPIQCASIHADQAFLPGQFPLSIVDGSSATRWLPSSLPATVTVRLNKHLNDARQILGFGFQLSNFTDFQISFFDQAGAVKASYSSSGGSSGTQLGFKPLSAHDVDADPTITRKDSGWKYFKLDQPIGLAAYANLTVFDSHDDALHPSHNTVRNNSRLCSMAEWTLFTSLEHPAQTSSAPANQHFKQSESVGFIGKL